MIHSALLVQENGKKLEEVSHIRKEEEVTLNKKKKNIFLPVCVCEEKTTSLSVPTASEENDIWKKN